MRRRFFGRRVEVTCEKDAAGFVLPARFELGDRCIHVAEVLAQWHDHGFHPGTRRRSWLERRHRTHYRVRGDDGCLYDLYVDRTGERRDWFVTEQSDGRA
jgi:hypothetical protein